MICENCLRKDTCKEVCIDLEWEINPICQKCEKRIRLFGQRKILDLKKICSKCKRIDSDYEPKEKLPSLYKEQLWDNPEEYPKQTEEWAKKSLKDKVYELHFKDRMKPSEIAHLAGCSRQHIYRLIKKIRNKN